jgi:multiple sugar transport system permease protein
MMAPGIAATAVLLFIQSWNEFLFAVTLTSFDSQTAPVAISLLQTDRGIFYGQQSAAALLLVIPVIIGTYAVQKYLVRGLTLGAVKG